jgi:hypothetical protein
MSEACSTNGVEETCIKEFGPKAWQEKTTSENYE